jgi:uroporphyrin-III C-methyltransferase/precorrin-2 dehydrogenase/sirohydrochlorin ferrochelatase
MIARVLRQVGLSWSVAEAPSLLPLFMRLTGRSVLVVGGGAVAERKVGELLAVGARVRVVAPVCIPSLEQAAARGEVVIDARGFVPDDLDGAWLAVAATDDPAVNAAVAAAAEPRRVFVNAVDDPPNATAFFGSVIRRAPFLVAISSSGELPALSRLLREVLERALPDERYIEAARALRRKWRAEGTVMSSRFAELLRGLVALDPPR